MKNTDVLIIGGGVVGLSLAWKIRQRGATVTVLERGPFPVDTDGAPPGGQATWASAGMLAPLAETTSQGTFLDLGLASLKLYPHFVKELSQASGVEVSLQGPGMLRLAASSSERDAVVRLFEWQRTLGLPLEWLEGEEVSRLEPALAGTAGLAVRSPLEKHVDPRILLWALARALSLSGVNLVSHCPAEGFQVRENRVFAVETPGGAFSCGELVLAGGCWTGELARKLDTVIPVKPLRGQIAALRAPGLLSHTIYTHEGYLVPRDDGRLLVGATEEDAGFQSTPTAGGVQRLLRFAISLVPSLGQVPFESAWAGLRPVSPDHLPLLGTAPGWKNLHIASGHFRNGILLTPITASLMSDWVLDRKPHSLLSAVEPGRFQRE